MSKNNKKTVLKLKEKRKVSPDVLNKAKEFAKIKKDMLKKLTEKEMTVPELSKEMNMPQDKTMFYLMSLLKYGFVEVVGIDDMDEYFYYKVKNNG